MEIAWLKSVSCPNKTTRLVGIPTLLFLKRLQILILEYLQHIFIIYVVDLGLFLLCRNFLASL